MPLRPHNSTSVLRRPTLAKLVWGCAATASCLLAWWLTAGVDLSIAQRLLLAALPVAVGAASILTARRRGPQTEQHSPMPQQPIAVEDLLGRQPAQLDNSRIRQWLSGQVILVTGSAGSIGSELCRQLLSFAPRRLIVVDRSENGQFHLERELAALDSSVEIEVCLADINDAERMESLFARCRPDVVLHAAAYKHVPLLESNPGEAVKNITLATARLAELADRYLVRSFVLVSTDKAVRPSSVMGCAKRAAELYVQALDGSSACRFVTVRFGNVLDSAGSVVPIFRNQIAAGGPVTVTHPQMQRYFMTIPEASQLVIQAGAIGRGGDILVLDMGHPIRIVDLARDMIRLHGLRPDHDIEIRFTGPRPGEKLFEQLFADGERYDPTEHDKIHRIQSPSVRLAAVRDHLNRLEQRADAPAAAVVLELARLVPEFQSHDGAFAVRHASLPDRPGRTSDAPSPRISIPSLRKAS